MRQLLLVFLHQSRVVLLSLTKIIESFRLEETLKIIKTNHQPNTVKFHHYTISLSSASICLSNTSRDGDSTTSLGSLFQCPITLSVTKFFLVPNLNLP